MKFSSDAAFPRSKAVNDIPLLHVVVMETLLLHPAADGGQRRVVPSLSCKLHGHELPAGTVQLCTHMSIRSTVTPKSSWTRKWNPRRWLDADPEQLRQMNRWFRAFGSSSMQCIGKDFAVYGKHPLGDWDTGWWYEMCDCYNLPKEISARNAIRRTWTMNSHPPTGLRRLMINDSNQYREKGKYIDAAASYQIWTSTVRHR